jgi:probable O-glycosylation ligase (exosortase A-associated)
MRDLLVLTAMVFFVAMALRHTFSAYLLWGWSGLVGLNYYVFGFMGGVQYVTMFALITLAGFALRPKVRGLSLINPTSMLMAAFVAHGLVCAMLAYPGLPRNWELWSNVAKTALFCAFMPMLAHDRLRIHAVVLMIAIGLGLHSVLDGLKFIASGGAHNAQSLPKFGDNNHLALVLVMLLPFLFYLFVHSRGHLVRWGFAGAAVLTAMAVLATASRGGFVGMFLVAVALVLTTKRRWLALVVVALGATVVFNSATDEWVERMQTIQTAEEDASFMGRVAAWKVSSAIAVENPVFGGGFRALQSAPIWDRFRSSQGLLGFVDTPQLARSGVAAHSIWFEVMGDQGFVGLLLFMLLIGNVLVVRRAVWQRVRTLGREHVWAGDLADAIAISMLAFVVTGSLLSAAYFELPYICMMVMECLRQYLVRVANANHQ